MASIHIAAKVGEVAERVLLPGDPVRAKIIAENFLDDVHQYTAIKETIAIHKNFLNANHLAEILFGQS